MPANLPPHYYSLEQDYRDEKDPREKLRLAQELLRLMPKHKGTDHLQADMKSKISKLKKQIEGGGVKHGAKQAPTFDFIEKEGARQVILIGPPNSGKSTMVDTLTAAKPLIGDYPYTTREPMTGMMPYDTIQIQLIDTPPIADDYLESFVPPLIRNADLAVLMIDASSPGFEDRLKVVFDRLDEKKVRLCPSIPDEIDDFRIVHRKTVLAAHKYLDDGGAEGLELIKEKYSDFRIVPSSVLDDDAIENFKNAIFEELDIIRIFTKKIGHDPDFNDPIVLPVGGTVEDAALELHKDFAKKLQFAKIWGGGKFEGQKVKNSYILTDRDIVEFHI